MKYKNLICGKWINIKQTFPVINPYTQEKVADVPDLTLEEIEKAVNFASDYRSSLNSYQRYEILIGTANEIKERKKELSDLISLESGICIKSSRHEVDRAIQALIFSAEEAKRLDGETFQTDVTPNFIEKIGITIYQPVGLVLAITPFNHPLNQVVHKLGPAIAANNKVILKPSSKTPLTAIRFIEILLNNGLPKEMVSIITCNVRNVFKKLLSHPKIDMVTFTGSTEVGELIHKTIGVKKCLLELGGNDVFIVLDDADLNIAVDIAVKGAFSNSGQRCTSIKRILVQNCIAKKFVNSFVNSVKQLHYGNPFDENTDVGTVINENAAKYIENVVKLAIKDGAKLLTGGKRKKALYAPTVLDHVNPKSKLVVEETFGPTAPIIRFQSINDAIEIANSTKFGLQAGICTEKINNALSIAKKLHVGAVMINEGPGFRIERFPFGGIKKSGIGREGIKCAVKEMSNIKLILI